MFLGGYLGVRERTENFINCQFHDYVDVHEIANDLKNNSWADAIVFLGGGGGGVRLPSQRSNDHSLYI